VKLRVVDVNQAAMVPALKVEVSLLLEALIDYTVQGVRGSDWWYRTNLAIGKNAADFILSRQVDGAIQHLLDRI
jgi:hypothetical protein